MKILSPRIALALLTAALSGPPAAAQTRDSKFWIPNNTVKTIRVDEVRNRVIVGGSFDYFGPLTGHHAVLDKTTGLLDEAFPTADETVSAAVPDGSGGVYIGGSFTTVGGIPRNNLAHINASGAVTSWNPNPDGGVNALLISDGILYVGGSFTAIAGETDSCLAAFDAATGAYLSSFQSAPFKREFGASVNALAVSGSRLYIAGGFDTVGTQHRNGAAAVDRLTGELSTWDPNPEYASDPNSLYLSSLAAHGSGIFVGGRFTSIGGAERRSIAKVDTTTGAALSWDAGIDPYITAGMFGSDTNSTISCMTVKGDTLYVGGIFSGFQSNSHPSLFALNASTAAAITGAAPSLEDYAPIDAFLIDGTTMYIGGDFKQAAGQLHKNLAAFDTETGSVLSWNPVAGDDVNALALFGSNVYAGGAFTSVNGVVRNGIAALDLSTGEPTSWNPNAVTSDNEFTINKIAVADTVVYLGGRFTDFNGSPRYGLASVGITGGAVQPFAPVISDFNMFSGSADPEIFDLTASSTTLYVGGQFDTVGTTRRRAAAAFSLTDGSLTGWNPDITQSGERGTVQSIEIAGEKVFIGTSSMDMAGDSSRTNIAAVDTGSGSVLSWYPSIDGYVYVMQMDGSTLYVGGSFNTVSGLTRNNLAAFDTSGVVPTAWSPNASSSVEDIAVTATSVYVAGFFDNVGGATRYEAAALDKTAGAATAWDPQLSQFDYAEAIGVSYGSQNIFIGGGFSAVLGETSPHFAAVTNPYDAALPVELSSFTAAAGNRGILLSWSTATEADNYGFEVERNVSGAWAKIGFVPGSGNSSAPRTYSFLDAGAAGTASYRLKQIDNDGSFSYSATVEAALSSPGKFALYQNFPNPFNPVTGISYQLPAAARVSLKVYDLLGKEVASLADGMQEAGSYSIPFDGSKLASGVYLYRLTAGEYTAVKKLLLMK